MKNFKKLSLSLLTSALVLAGIGTSINADEDAKTVDVTYTLEEGYEWTIPSDIVLEGTTAKNYGQVAVSNVHLEPGHKLTVKYDSSNMAFMSNQLDNGSTIAMFNIGKDSDLSTAANKFNPGTLILSVPYNYDDSTVQGVDVYACLIKDVLISGNYLQTVKFVSEISSIA